jgi:hypothetical protein
VRAAHDPNHRAGGSRDFRFGLALVSACKRIACALHLNPGMRAANLENRLMMLQPEHFAKYAKSAR